MGDLNQNFLIAEDGDAAARITCIYRQDKHIPILQQHGNASEMARKD